MLTSNATVRVTEYRKRINGKNDHKWKRECDFFSEFNKWNWTKSGKKINKNYYYFWLHFRCNIAWVCRVSKRVKLGEQASKCAEERKYCNFELDLVYRGIYTLTLLNVIFRSIFFSSSIFIFGLTTTTTKCFSWVYLQLCMWSRINNKHLQINRFIFFSVFTEWEKKSFINDDILIQTKNRRREIKTQIQLIFFSCWFCVYEIKCKQTINYSGKYTVYWIWKVTVSDLLFQANKLPATSNGLMRVVLSISSEWVRVFV